MTTIREDIVVKLEERLQLMRVHFGYNNIKLENAEDLGNQILENHLIKIENKEKNPNANNGVNWLIFKRKHFNEIYRRDKGRCVFCNKRLSKKECTIDHDIPVTRGGRNILKNILVSCSWCNQDKGVLTKEEYQYKQLHNASKGIYPPK